MNTILQLTRPLKRRPEPVAIPGVRLRHFAGEPDIEQWLDLRRRAFARQRVGVGAWNARDFTREFLQKPWWRPEWMWFAETIADGGAPCVAGTVTLALRGDADDARPVIHWLAVAPTFRRRGLGRLLVATAETAAWDAGWRQIWLETHRGWREAVALYDALGYRATVS